MKEVRLISMSNPAPTIAEQNSYIEAIAAGYKHVREYDFEQYKIIEVSRKVPEPPVEIPDLRWVKSTLFFFLVALFELIINAEVVSPIMTFIIGVGLIIGGIGSMHPWGKKKS